MTDPPLAEILEAAWRMLVQGCGDPAHGFHWPVLASLASDAGPDARTVVLRAVDPQRRELQVHSDAQAGKLIQLRRDPRVCLVFHDAPARTQLRLHGQAHCHVGDALAEQAWQALPARSQALYEGVERFAVLRIGVQRLDWLLLDPAGHRRAGFGWHDTAARGEWLAP